MNERTELLGKECKPVLSVVVYEHKVGGSGQYYLESHPINDQGQVMAGRPLLQETISDIVELFYDDRKDRSQISGFVPENILTYKPLSGGNYRLVWYRPEEARYIHFAKQLRLDSGKVWIPPMIYIASRNELTVYALKGTGRPSEKTKIYRAPFHNVHDDGDVCLGNAKVKKPIEKTFESITRYWEDLFWRSEFSHLNGASNPTKSDLDTLWKRLVKSKCRLKWDKLDELIITKHKSLKNLLR
ncbi:MAG: hypothetical protein ABIT05_01250 [Chitinophagaceae bacterium]